MTTRSPPTPTVTLTSSPRGTSAMLTRTCRRLFRPPRQQNHSWPLQLTSNDNDFKDLCHISKYHLFNIQFCSEPLVEESEPKIPSLLSTAETCPRTISTQDFLIPMNLLSTRKSPDRIYGFYYLVN